ncbi:chemotaxis protein CheY [Syntrophotalea carbinolica DSM 2380]|uniref:Chemotaxis protein CheY n=1 Tax=Syntrophotalea carbinolica (strain DSM 2380 / NBRC 103641 / GraBd1) TaxID=338963 RepID=Q3A4Q0_SYNC1|nr:response regulator [Syntrophotalea carbinolica]ABA88657.1 chemotaxis protein CheY [Syntrophotalea carbinolica DSM 2380]
MSGYNVLVVEDSSIMRQLLVMSLRRLPGIVVMEASDGLEALKIIANKNLSLIFSDVNMPGMDGLKLVRMLRGDRRTKDIPVVMVTTEGAEEDRDRAMALGATEYITKPVQAGNVVEIASRLLGLSTDIAES